MGTEEPERIAQVIALRKSCKQRIESLKAMLDYEKAMLFECDRWMAAKVHNK
jgi:hypothetical protein